jgi:hypothetical protein
MFLQKKIIWEFTRLQLILFLFSCLLIMLTFFNWLHIYPDKNIITAFLPVKLNKHYTGIDILGYSTLYCLLIIVFSVVKFLNNFLLPLLIAGVYFFYYYGIKFITKIKPPIGYDIIKDWFSYEFLFPLYVFIGVYSVLVISSILILFNKEA